MKITAIGVGLVILLYLVVSFINLIRKPTETFVVEKSKIYKEEYTQGYIIRDEALINIENIDRGIVQIKAEGDKVAKGEPVFRYCIDNEQEISEKIEAIDVQIGNSISSDNTYYSTDIKLINNQVEGYLDRLYDEKNNLEKISLEKSNISNSLTQKLKLKAENCDDEELKSLVEQRNEYEKSLTSNSDYIYAENSGVISYRIDGLEDALKSDDFSYLSEEYLKKLDIQTGQIVASSTNKGKIINNFKCNIACVLDSEEARNSEVGKSIKIRLQNMEETPAKIVYKAEQSDKKVLLVFEVSNNVTDLIQYRKSSFDVIWWSDSGLRIPNSALKYENDLAYVIRNRAGLEEKIYVKVLRTNEKYSIVDNYSYSELKEHITDMSILSNKKNISVYDEIEI